MVTVQRTIGYVSQYSHLSIPFRKKTNIKHRPTHKSQITPLAMHTRAYLKSESKGAVGQVMP